MTDKISMRYFFTLDGGATPADITVWLDSSEGGKLGPVTRFKDGVYFVEVDFSGEQLYPNRIDARKPAEQFRRNAQFTISATSKEKWNLRNDWSAQGLALQPILQPKIAIYHAGKLVGGEEPR